MHRWTYGRMSFLNRKSTAGHRTSAGLTDERYFWVRHEHQKMMAWGRRSYMDCPPILRKDFIKRIRPPSSPNVMSRRQSSSNAYHLASSHAGCRSRNRYGRCVHRAKASAEVGSLWCLPREVKRTNRRRTLTATRPNDGRVISLYAP